VVGDVRRTEIRRTEQLMTGSSSFNVEITVKEFKRYKSLGIRQISAELIQAGGKPLYYGIHKLTTPI